MTEKEYFDDVRRMRRLLERALTGDVELPDFLKPENQVVSDVISKRSKAAREALLRGDYDPQEDLEPEE